MEKQAILMHCRNESPKAQERTLETKAKILECSIRLFTKVGFASTSIRDIAAQAEVKNQVIGYHFGNKTQLWLYCIQLLATDLQKRNSVLIIDPNAPRESFKRHVSKVIKNNIAYPELLRMIFHEIMVSSPQCDFIKDLMIASAAQIQSELKKGIELGFIKDVPLVDLYFIYNNGVNSRFMTPLANELISGKPNEDEEMIASHVNTLTKLLFVET